MNRQGYQPSEGPVSPPEKGPNMKIRKGMYIYLQVIEGHMPFITMHTAQGDEQPGWLASQADMLAHDWETVER